MRHRVWKSVWVLVLLAGLAGAAAVGSAQDAVPGEEPEDEFLIVKYGSLQVKGQAQEAKVYVDDIYKGPVNTLIENVIAGEHAISVVLDDKTVSGQFEIRKNETLKLDARFNEERLVSLGEKEPPAKKPEQPKSEKKKPEPAAKKPAKPEAEEGKDVHLHVFRIEFKDRDAQLVSVGTKANEKVVAGFNESRTQTGKYYRTKQGLLLCESGPCVQEWTGKFFYTDEKAKRDAFLVTWKQTVFSGITPTGTTNREITWCLNGSCKKVLDTDQDRKAHTMTLDRYVMSWSKSAAVIRRGDIMKEIQKEGRSIPEW